jgi:hypothetical protein
VRILRRGFEQMSITDKGAIEQTRRVLYSELNALLLLAREQQVPPAHDEGAATLPRPELLAAMATVRDELATVPCGGTKCQQHTEHSHHYPLSTTPQPSRPQTFL